MDYFNEPLLHLMILCMQYAPAQSRNEIEKIKLDIIMICGQVVCCLQTEIFHPVNIYLC